MLPRVGATRRQLNIFILRRARLHFQLCNNSRVFRIDFGRCRLGILCSFLFLQVPNNDTLGMVIACDFARTKKKERRNVRNAHAYV